MAKLLTALTVLLSITIFALAASDSLAHSGGTDAYGCHTDHSTGLWHCH